MLNEKQIRYFAEIFSNLGLVFFATIVLPGFMGELELIPVIIGLIYALICWCFGFLILKQEV